MGMDFYEITEDYIVTPQVGVTSKSVPATLLCPVFEKNGTFME